jgi:hypothetical protein
MSTSVVATAMAQITISEDISITCYEDEVPPFVEAELERLYGSVFSSLAQFRVYGGAEGASTYVMRKGSDVTSVLLFRRERRSVRVVNEWIKLGAAEILCFVNYIFTAYESVNIISLHAVDAEIVRLPFPFQRFNCTDDSVLTLPATPDAYLAQLGKATRKNIRRYMGRLTEHFPSFCYRAYVKDEVSEPLVRDIIMLNRLRMASKNKVSGLNDKEAQGIIRLARMKGFVVAATIDGRVCAGAITYRFGNNYFSFVRAHDPRYDSYRLGLVCGYLLVAECIARGGKELHLMWGREEHKSLLLGAQRELDHLTIYRSRTQVVLNGGTALKNAFSACMRRARLRTLHKAKHGDDAVSRIAMSSLNVLRRVKQIRHGLLRWGRKA